MPFPGKPSEVGGVRFATGYKFDRSRACCGKSLIGDDKLSRYRISVRALAQCCGTSLIGDGKLSRYRISVGALAQCRGTICLVARNLSRCRN